MAEMIQGPALEMSQRDSMRIRIEGNDVRQRGVRRTQAFRQIQRLGGCAARIDLGGMGRRGLKCKVRGALGRPGCCNLRLSIRIERRLIEKTLLELNVLRDHIVRQRTAERWFNCSVSCSIRCQGTARAAPMINTTAAPNRIWHLAAREI